MNVTFIEKNVSKKNNFAMHLLFIFLWRWFEEDDDGKMREGDTNAPLLRWFIFYQQH